MNKKLILPVSLSPKSGRAVIVPSAKVSRNPYSQHPTPYDPGTDFWRWRLQWDYIRGQEAFDLDNLLTQLRGSSNGVWLKDFNYKTNSTWGGNLVVDGANQEGNLLSLRGGTTSSTIALVGARFQIGDHMHQVVENGITDASGRVTLVIEPQLRIIPADGQSIITDNPMGLARWVNPQSRPQFNTHRGIVRGADLLFEEA